MDSTDSRLHAAELMLRVSTAWLIEYTARHRKVVALADHYGMDVTRIAEITELPVAEVRRILVTPEVGG